MKKKLGENKHEFVWLINTHKLKTAAEIGVAGGGITQKVMKFCPTIEKYYAVDPWEVYVEWFNRKPHPYEYNQEHYDTIYSKFKRHADRWPDKIVTVRKQSTTAAYEFKAEGIKLDIIYIDAIHDKVNIINDIYHWLPNIKDDGIISGHDYAKRFTPMVEALHTIFENDLDIRPKRDDVPKMSLGNALGRNWWVMINGNRKLYINRIKKNYGDLLWSKQPKMPLELQN